MASDAAPSTDQVTKSATKPDAKPAGVAAGADLLELRKDVKLLGYRVQALINVLSRTGVIVKDDVKKECDELVMAPDEKEE